MQKKVLFVATTGTHINSFHLPYVCWFQQQGYEVHIACKGAEKVTGGDKVMELPFERSPLRRQNITAYRMLRRLIDTEQYALVHGHTPMGGVLARLAARRSRKANGTKVLYTAHGFHFYKGAPLKAWLSFFLVEWLLALCTDTILTINREDFNALHRFRFPCRGKVATNGVGIDPQRIQSNGEPDRAAVRKSLGFAPDEIVILYIAEFIPRKNHRFLFSCIPAILQKHPKVRFVFAGGKAVTGNEMEDFARANGFLGRVLFTGFTKNIGQYIRAADIGVSTSKAEGLGLGLAELMCQEVPVVLSNIRGHNELVEDGVNGFFFEPGDQERFIASIDRLCSDRALLTKMGQQAKESMKPFLLQHTLPQTTRVYEESLCLPAATLDLAYS